LPARLHVNIFERNAQAKEVPVSETEPTLSPQDCLIALMIAISASNEQIATAELISIEALVDHLPVFADYDKDRLKRVSKTVFDLFSEEDGLDALFGLVRDNLPEKLWETAYALSCDVAAADGRLYQEELQFLAEIRYELRIDRLHAAAIERGARVRRQVL